MAFRGWPAEAIEFFEGLEADNSKAYWQDHKADYEKLVAQKSVPTLPEMTDRQLVERLDLTRPNLAEVKKAYDAKDDKALEKALSDYLKSFWGATAVQPTI